MVFTSREDAGRKLGRHLTDNRAEVHRVLGLPRGGVVVAAEVARWLHLPLGVVVVRKLGHPRHREFAVGAVAEGGVVVLDSAAIETTRVRRPELEEVIAEETQRLQEYRLKFEQEVSAPFEGEIVLLVDDGLATGATAEAAVLSARQRGAARVAVAVPVASESACERLNRVAEEVIALWVDPHFDAVGRYYEEFAQTTDEQVVRLLRANREGKP